MSRRTRIAAALSCAGLTALSVAGPVRAQETRALVNGFVRLPDGFKTQDVQLKVCAGAADPCDLKASGKPSAELSMFTFYVPRGSDYVVTGWLDADRDGRISDGDLTGVSGGGRPQPARGLSKFSFDMTRVSMPRQGGGGGGRAGVISGSVTVPVGADTHGMIAFACPEPFDDCDNESIQAPVTMSGDRGSYAIRGLNPRTRYQVMIWKDADGDKDASNGDLLRAANDGEPITPGTGPQDVRVGVFHNGKFYARLEAVPGYGGDQPGGREPDRAPAGGGGAPGSGGAMAGSWSQASTSNELTLTPRVRVMPGIAPGAGFAVGTMGTGASQVTTMIQNEYASVPVNRRMTLDVQPNGAFRWVITKSRASGKSCRVTTREEKTGRVQLAGGRATFAISGGTSSSEDSCNPSKASSSSKGPSSESYNYSVSGSTLRINGSGGVNWVFNRR